MNEMAIRYWAMQYGRDIEIVYPESLRENVRQTAEEIFKKHGGIIGKVNAEYELQPEE